MFTNDNYTWLDFDKDAEQLGYNRSQFFTYLYKTYKDNRRLNDIKTVIVFMMLGFIILALLIIYTTFWGL